MMIIHELSLLRFQYKLIKIACTLLVEVSCKLNQIKV